MLGATTPDAEQLHDLASHLLKDNAQNGCGKDSCKILVNEFFLADGKSSAYGIKLADQLSSQLSAQQMEIQILDRRSVHGLLELAYLPENLLSDVRVARWVGEIFGASKVVLGSIKKQKGNQIQVSVHLVDVTTGQIGPTDEAILQNSSADLSPLQRPQKVPPGGVRVNGEDLYRAGTDGLATPTCFYMPNPPYSEAARKAKYSGVVLAVAVVSADGHVTHPRVIRSPALGLDDTTGETMRTWRCKPANLDGKPVPTIVTFQVNFRPY